MDVHKTGYGLLPKTAKITTKETGKSFKQAVMGHHCAKTNQEEEREGLVYDYSLHKPLSLRDFAF